MMDRSREWGHMLHTALGRPLPVDGRGSSSIYTSDPLLPVSLSDPFTQQAKDVLASVREKEQLLVTSRHDYVDPHRYVPSRASEMRDAERDRIDQLLASFIVKCGAQIEIMKYSLTESVAGEKERRLISPGSRHAHQSAVVTYLAERLQSLSVLFQEMQSQRQGVGSFASKGRLQDVGSRGEVVGRSHQTLGPGGEVVGALKRIPVVNTPLELAEERGLAQRLSEASTPDPARKLVLERENREMMAQLQNELQDVRQMETRMVELSQLLGLFTSKLMEQHEQVEEIQDSAIDTNLNVEKGNEELLKTLERKAQASKTFALFVSVLALCLLLFDQLIP